MTEVDYRGGGRDQARDLAKDDPFEMAVESALGVQIRNSDRFAIEFWSALTNVIWTSENGQVINYSYRAAGDLIAAVRGHGSYHDWYCCGPTAAVNPAIAVALMNHGWTCDPKHLTAPLESVEKHETVELKAHLVATAWAVPCPCCQLQIEITKTREDDAGIIHADEDDALVACPNCPGVFVEVLPAAVVAAAGPFYRASTL